MPPPFVGEGQVLWACRSDRDAWGSARPSARRRTRGTDDEGVAVVAHGVNATGHTLRCWAGMAEVAETLGLEDGRPGAARREGREHARAT